MADIMQQDLTVFWRNNTRASELFYDLLTRADRNAYDDDFLTALDAYQEQAPDTPNFYIFAARYLLAHGVYDEAARLGERAYRLRPVNCEVWKLLAAAYARLGRDLESITMQGYARSLYPETPIALRWTPETMHESLGRFSVAMELINCAPHIRNRAHIEDGKTAIGPDTFLGEEIPLTMPEGGPRFFTGTYVDEGFLSTMSTILDERRHDPMFMIHNPDVRYDLQKARTVTGDCRIEVPPGHTAAVRVSGTQVYQKFSIRTANETYPGYLGKWTFSDFRLPETAVLHSDAPYAVGAPVLLTHSPRRKKLVLNIFVDGFCRPAVQPLFAQHMPRLAKFFSRGVIFNNHFSASEFTLSSLPTIETGLYSHHTHIFNEKDSHELPADVRTLSECMHDLGYYCAAPLTTGEGVYYGTLRGHDRIVTTYGFQFAYMGAERTIRDLEAMPECDKFLCLYISDMHPLNIQTPLKFSTEVEASIPLADRFVKIDTSLPSVRLPHLPIYLSQSITSMHHVDRSIGGLLSYIEEHYDEDEYIVNLYSDHGCGLFDPTPPGGAVDFLGPYATGAVWMMRGAGVPKGVVADELTSTADIYPTLGHLCGFPVDTPIDGNLPAVFDGKERTAVYSASIYPGQTYKLAVRSKTHTLRLETREVVDEDGSVDFADARVGIYPSGYEWKEGHETDSESLRALFYPRAREFVRPIANNGEFWPAMRAARPQWFGEK